MIRSLWFKLFGAFAAIIVVMLLVVIFTVNHVTENQFDLYVTLSGQSLADQIAPRLVQYYADYGNWADAQTVIVNPWAISGGSDRLGMGGRMGNADHMRSGMMSDAGHMTLDMWSAMGFRLLLADEHGVVVADTEEALKGERLPPDALSQGEPVVVQGQQVGTILVTSPSQNPPSRETFLSAVGRAAFLAALAAGGMAILIGTWLMQRITSPLQQLQQASQKIAAGDLTARVTVASQDELSAVAQAFNRMAIQLDEQQRLRKQMVTDIAHELRTPISVMQGTLEALLDGVLQPEPSELRDLHGEAQRLARLVEDLRIMSLADAGQLALKQEPVDLVALARSVVGRMRPLAEAREIDLNIRTEQLVSPIKADADRVAQVLTNLIDNALRYTPVGGQVTVYVSQTNGTLQFAVEDNGPGIPAEEVPFVFERFWRGDKSRNRNSGGSGIGLAIVKQLVEMHKGMVSVDSQIGKGSTFKVSLPASH